MSDDLDPDPHSGLHPMQSGMGLPGRAADLPNLFVGCSRPGARHARRCSARIDVVSCGMGCPEPSICRDHGCQWEAEQQMQEAYFAEQEAQYHAEMEALYMVEMQQRYGWEVAYIWNPQSVGFAGFDPHEASYG
jgi:hypothetical protein